MDHDLLVTRFEAIRPELRNYLTRMILRPHLADDLVQSAYLRASAALESAPDGHEACRAWLFRIATNLALDELKRHSSWREVNLLDLRQAAEGDEDFVAASAELSGTPEMRAIAKEHLAVCFSCTLRNLSKLKAAALLLKEVYGFRLEEVAEILESRPAQVKNWLQEARQKMEAIYASTCALITKQGVCYQCVELDEFFAAGHGNPLRGRSESVQTRLTILQDLRTKPVDKWHIMLFELLDELN